MRLAIIFIVVLASSAAHAEDCLLKIIGVAHGDCPLETSAFPQDDAICRTYGLTPGTHDYKVCRTAKAHERKLTSDETFVQFFAEPAAARREVGRGCGGWNCCEARAEAIHEAQAESWTAALCSRLTEGRLSPASNRRRFFYKIASIADAREAGVVVGA